MKFPTSFLPKDRAVGSNSPVDVGLLLVLLPARLLAIAFARQSLFHPAFLAGFQMIGMPLDFLNDIFLLDLPFEPAQGVFKRFTLL